MAQFGILIAAVGSLIMAIWLFLEGFKGLTNKGASIQLNKKSDKPLDAAQQKTIGAVLVGLGVLMLALTGLLVFLSLTSFA